MEKNQRKISMEKKTVFVKKRFNEQDASYNVFEVSQADEGSDLFFISISSGEKDKPETRKFAGFGLSRNDLIVFAFETIKFLFKE